MLPTRPIVAQDHHQHTQQAQARTNLTFNQPVGDQSFSGGNIISNDTFSRPNLRTPNISEDFREEAVDSGKRGWRAPRRETGWRGCTRASLRFSTRHTTTRTDRSALQVRLRASSVPSDCNRSPRGRPQGCCLGRSGSGEAVEALGRSDGIHQGTRDRLERSASPDPRGPWTHHLHPGGLRGLGRPWMGGQWVDMRGVCPGFVHLERRWDALRCP